MDRRVASIGGLVLVLALFLAVNILAGAVLRSARVDLTEESLYTLSPGAKSIAADIDEPIRLYLYYSSSLASDVGGAVEAYGRRVRELLEDFERAAGGGIILEVIDPVPFSEAEDDAAVAGIVGSPLGGGLGSFYFGLHGTNSVDGQETIRVFDPRQEQFLEYEIARLIYTLAHPEKPVVGIVTSLPLDGMPGNPQLGIQGEPPWQIMREIRALFDVRMIPETDRTLPEDVDLLIVIHPKAVSDGLLYSIDQFVLGGGHALVFIDPLCEVDVPPAARQDPMARFRLERSSNLPKLMLPWGVMMEANKAAADRTVAIRVADQSAGRGAEPVPFIAYLALGSENIDRDDPATGRLTSINLASAGILRPVETAETTWTPLFRTTTDSMALNVEQLKFFPQPKELLAQFVPGDEELVMAGRVSGPVKTAFPDGPPAVGGEAVDASAHLAESTGPVNIIITADCDMLFDQFWVQQQRLGGISLGPRKIAGNGDFLINALENLMGSNDLISVRARGRFARPFEKVEEIRRVSEQEYLAEEQRLNSKLEETEKKINELQAQRPDQGELILTAEQQAEIARFNEERRETRRQLRAVRLDLRSDIEKLGLRLRFWNILAMPILIAAAAIALWIYRIVRRRTDRRAMAQT